MTVTAPGREIRAEDIHPISRRAGGPALEHD